MRGGRRGYERQITQRSSEDRALKIITTSDMELQVCGCCGWSKVTSYHGLRTHQGKKGCTPKGMKIAENEQFRVNSFLPRLTYTVPPIKVEEPLMNIFTPSIKSEGDRSMWTSRWEEARQQDIGSINSGPVRKGNVSPNLTAQESQTEEAVLNIIKTFVRAQQHCWQTDTDSDKTHRALDFTSDAQPFLMPVLQTHSTQANPAVKDTNKSLFETPQRTYQTTTELEKAQDFSTGAQQSYLMPVSQIFSNQANPAVTDTNKSPFENLQHIHQTTTNMEKVQDFSTLAQQSYLMPVSQIFSNQANPAVTDTNKSLFETPQHTHQTATKARRALDFSTGAQQAGQLDWDLPTTTAQETAVQSKEKEREKERAAQKQLKAKQDRMKADLHQKIQMREQKMADVRSSAKACKGSLDTEWLEINNVFSEVMRVVEDTRQKALQPLEDRRQRVKREAQDLVQKLQKEIDKLKKTIDELDRNPDLQVSPPTGLDESRNWKGVTVNSSFSLGTLRSETSNMMVQIQQRLEELSSVELKRIPTFAVDVKLDPTTAHRCLVLSPDGKEVKDGAKNQNVPDVPERFDMFGSILGLNRLTSGKSYWEVEVSNKTGWDLGVARGDANRKGKLTLTPDNGYWVTVHYEDEEYAALTAPAVRLSLNEKPQKVGVFVDYEEGLVSFYDVTARSHIFSFTECSFSDEIFPYFSPHLKQYGKNCDPLIISAVKKQK